MSGLRTARAFRRFVPEDFLALLGARDFARLEAGVGVTRDVTVLFSDMRNFTAMSERLGPAGTFRFVSGCLRRFIPAIVRHGGFIDKFIGDAVMAIFPSDPYDAVLAAKAMQDEVNLFNDSEAGRAWPLAIGVGVHRGPVMIGTIGDGTRMDVTAIGDVVNVASRLESLTKKLGVAALASDAIVRERMSTARRSLRCVGAMKVKGRDDAVDLFELLDNIASPDERVQKDATRERFVRGLLAFQLADIPRAHGHFDAVCRHAPLDGVARAYRATTEKYLAEGLPAGFNGELGSL